MDIATIATMIGSVITIIGTNIALMSWLKADIGHIRSDMKSFEGEVRSDMKSYEGEIRGWKEEINKEIKDFHGRLCSLEGRFQDSKM